MKLARRCFAWLLAALIAAPAFAQTYPTNNPTYIPTAILGATTLSAPGTVTFQNNGNGTVLLRVAGTNTGLSATVQISESRAGTPAWTTVGVDQIGGPNTSTITTNGLYRLNATGAAQVRLNVASITGTNVIVTASATPAPQFVQSLPQTKATYAAVATIPPAASATDLLTLTGSATKTVQITRASCSGTASANAATTIFALRRSTANSGGTSGAAILTRFDSNNPTASAVAASYSANPTTGTLVGNLRAGTLVLAVATSPVAVQPLAWDFGMRPGEQPVILRGTSEVFAINGGGATFQGGASLQCAITWTEE